MKILTFETENGKIEPDFDAHLSRLLASASPAVSVTLESASFELKELFAHWDGEESLVSILASHFNEDTTNVRVLVSATGCAKFREYGRHELRHAAWGCCLSGFLALEYAPESRLTTQLHEALHLFGVDECYDEITLKPKSDCTDENCLMRYGVTSTHVCSKAISQIRS